MQLLPYVQSRLLITYLSQYPVNTRRSFVFGFQRVVRDVHQLLISLFQETQIELNDVQCSCWIEVEITHAPVHCWFGSHKGLDFLALFFADSFPSCDSATFLNSSLSKAAWPITRANSATHRQHFTNRLFFEKLNSPLHLHAQKKADLPASLWRSWVCHGIY